MSAMMTLSHALKLIPGATLVGDGSTSIHRVHTDTRTIEPGDLFVALQGERFDANDMLHKVVYILVSTDTPRVTARKRL